MKEYTKQDLDGLQSGDRGQIIDGEKSYVVVGEVAYKLSEVITDLLICCGPKKENKSKKKAEAEAKKAEKKA